MSAPNIRYGVSWLWKMVQLSLKSIIMPPAATVFFVQWSEVNQREVINTPYIQYDNTEKHERSGFSILRDV